MQITAFHFAFLAGLSGLACTCCRPAASVEIKGRPTIPDLPQVGDQGLRQQLFTLREMARQYVSLSVPDQVSDEKTAKRLALLRQGFKDLENKCRVHLESITDNKEPVVVFLDRCRSTVFSAP
jgi:hypothetical protein